MICYFANRNMQVIGMASTELPDGYYISDDKWVEDIDSGVATFEFKIGYTDSQHLTVKDMCQVGNYVFRSHDNDGEIYIITDTTDESGTFTIYAEDAGLDLLNDVCGAFSADQAHYITWYINKFAAGSGFEIGINEIPNYMRLLSWEGESTATERIRSVATQFDNAEIGYSYEIDKLNVIHKYINIYKKRGKDVLQELRLEREIKSITETRSITNLATALAVTGGTPEGQDDPITLAGYQYDDGDIYVSDDGIVCSREANKNWPRPGTADYITASYSYDTTSQKELLSRAITELKKRREPEVNYDIDLYYLPQNLRIGDRVRIVDNHGKLYLSARLLQLSQSVCENMNSAIFGEYLITDSGLSDMVLDLSQKYTEAVKHRPIYTWIAYADDSEGTGISTSPDGKKYIGVAANRSTLTPDLTDPTVYTWSLAKGTDAILLQIESVNGTYFKNTAVNTTLTVTIRIGGTIITNSEQLAEYFGGGASLVWSEKKKGETEYTQISSNDSRIGDKGFYMTISASDIDEQSVFECVLNLEE